MTKLTGHANPSVRALTEVRRRLDLCEQNRTMLLARRDQCIDQARADGVVWADINTACMTTNMQRSYDRRQPK